MEHAKQKDVGYIPDHIRITGRAQPKAAPGKNVGRKAVPVTFLNEDDELFRFENRTLAAEYFGITKAAMDHVIKGMKSRYNASGNISGRKYFFVEER